MKFQKTFLLETILDDEELQVYDKITENSRWTIGHELVFKHEDKFYITHYRVGATEYQDESPWEYDGPEIECEEVVPVEKTVIVYEVKK